MAQDEILKTAAVFALGVWSAVGVAVCALIGTAIARLQR